LAQAIVNSFHRDVEEIVLVPSGGGCYEISVDGQNVYSKLKTGQHISDADAVNLIRAAKGR